MRELTSEFATVIVQITEVGTEAANFMLRHIRYRGGFNLVHLEEQS